LEGDPLDIGTLDSPRRIALIATDREVVSSVRVEVRGRGAMLSVFASLADVAFIGRLKDHAALLIHSEIGADRVREIIEIRDKLLQNMQISLVDDRDDAQRIAAEIVSALQKPRV
jgi:hypothetical protein